MHECAACDYAYFPIDAVASQQVCCGRKRPTQTCMIDRNGMTGIHLLRCLDNSVYHRATIVVILSGYAYRICTSSLGHEIGLFEYVFKAMMRYQLYLILQISTSAACNRHHRIEQWLSNYLLNCLDNNQVRVIKLTQQHLADLAGVRRESITYAANELCSIGAIRYTRGVISIIDRGLLERKVCECYFNEKKTASGINNSGQKPIVDDDFFECHPH